MIKHKWPKRPFFMPGAIAMQVAAYEARAMKPPPPPGLSDIETAEWKNDTPWLHPLTIDEQWLLRDKGQDERNQTRAASWRERSYLEAV